MGQVLSRIGRLWIVVPKLANPNIGLIVIDQSTMQAHDENVDQDAADSLDNFKRHPSIENRGILRSITAKLLHRNAETCK